MGDSQNAQLKKEPLDEVLKTTIPQLRHKYQLPIEYLMKNCPQDFVNAMLPPPKGMTALTENGTGRQTGINIGKLSERLRKAADSMEKVENVAHMLNNDNLLF